jgi:hypothetical protein
MMKRQLKGTRLRSAFKPESPPTSHGFCHVWHCQLGNWIVTPRDHRTAGQAASEAVRGYPSGTAPDSPVGHATGTLPGRRQTLSIASLSGKLYRRLCVRILPVSCCECPLTSAGVHRYQR